MNPRDEQLLAIRPIITTITISKNMSEGEQFQNLTLRPVLKLQHNLIIEIFRYYIKKHKNAFYELTLEKRLLYIENVIQKDIKFRNALKGIIIGQFTIEEYLNYTKNSSAINKRMMNLTKQRLIDSIQLFENPRILDIV